MNLQKFEKLVRKVVRQEMHEMLAKEYLKNKIQENLEYKPQQEVEPVYLPPEPKKQKLREDLVKKLGLNDESIDLFSNVQTAEDINESISEESMAKSGLMEKDWSAYLK